MYDDMLHISSGPVSDLLASARQRDSVVFVSEHGNLKSSWILGEFVSRINCWDKEVMCNIQYHNLGHKHGLFLPHKCVHMKDVQYIGMSYLKT